MPPVLRNISIDDRTVLRQLILSSLETIFSSFQILDLEAPLPGEPILLLNQDKSLVILSFDLHDKGVALLNGLRASEKLRQEEVLFKRLYPALKQQTADLRDSTKLFLLVPVDTKDELGPCFLNEKISAYTFQGIEANGEVLLIMEKVMIESASVKPAPIVTPVKASLAKTTLGESKQGTDHETDQHSVSNEAIPSEATPNEMIPDEVAEIMSTDEVLFFQQL